MASTVSKFKGFMVFAMILLLSQQSFADFFPMNCDDMKNASVALQESHSHMNSHMTSQMDMLDHHSSSKGKMASHEECDICDSNDCPCGEMGRCLSSFLAAAQFINHEYILFVDNGQRFLSPDEHSHSGNYLHPFRPPISC
tara:strand:- start:1519 stop:1941 length:423 start_codon:yes stop_codon:yes gene_type:complete